MYSYGAIHDHDYTEERLTEALQRYSDQHGPLALKGFSASWPCRQPGALLQCWSACSLLHLSLGKQYRYEELTIRGSNLARFDQLRSLSIYYMFPTEVRLLSEMLSALTRLTRLHLEGDLDVQDMPGLQQQLPSSLVHLALLVDSRHPIHVELQHLQALTCLSLLDITDNAGLPQQLQSLSCTGSSMKALQHCSQLQRLKDMSCRAAPAELCQLSGLTSLTSVDLSFHMDAADAAAPAFSQPPLRSFLHGLSINSAGTPKFEQKPCTA